MKKLLGPAQVDLGPQDGSNDFFAPEDLLEWYAEKARDYGVLHESYTITFQFNGCAFKVDQNGEAEITGPYKQVEPMSEWSCWVRDENESDYGVLSNDPRVELVLNDDNTATLLGVVELSKPHGFVKYVAEVLGVKA